MEEQQAGCRGDGPLQWPDIYLTSRAKIADSRKREREMKSTKTTNNIKHNRDRVVLFNSAVLFNLCPDFFLSLKG